MQTYVAGEENYKIMSATFTMCDWVSSTLLKYVRQFITLNIFRDSFLVLQYLVSREFLFVHGDKCDIL